MSYLFHPESLSALKGEDFFCSWSGGKDSSLALDQAILAGGNAKALFTMMAENNTTSRSHALPKSLLIKQGECLNMTNHFVSATWQDYEVAFITKLKELKADGIDYGVFGDIDIQSHNDWVQRVCGEAGIIAIQPLWQIERQILLDAFIDRQFKARVVVVNDNYLSADFIGKDITPETINAMQSQGIDASGEAGEYHTMVYDGPIFKAALAFKEVRKYSHDGFHFLQVDV